MTQPVHISPRFTAEKLAAGEAADHVDVYEDRLDGWLFEPARLLIDRGLDCWFPALALLLGYFEGHALYRDGALTRGRERAAFKSTFEEVCPHQRPMTGFEAMNITSQTSIDIGDILYEDGRCGLYHDGFARRRVLVADIEGTLAGSTHMETGRVAAVVVNVRRLLADQRAHARNYVLRLREKGGGTARERFMTGWYLRRPEEPVHFPERWPWPAQG